MQVAKSVRLAQILVPAVLCVLAGACPVLAQWPQWGGPDRNFVVAAGGLANSWPDDGPKRLWRKQLGDGYSAIVVDGDLLYTMYRKGPRSEYTVALDRATGQTVWKHKNTAPVPSESREHPGPHSTPLVVGDRLFTVGRNGMVHCFNKRDGAVLWKRDLVAEHGAVFSEWGYSPSPIAYGETVILPVGRRKPKWDNVRVVGGEPPADQVDENATGRTLMAFDQATGRVVWTSQDYGIDHSSPILMNVAGQDQLIQVTPEALFGVDPAGGELLWKHEFDEAGGFMVTPFCPKDDLLFISTPNQGSRVFELSRQDGRTAARERWHNGQLRIAFANPVQVGDYVVGSSGRPPILTCVNLETGKRVWMDRGFSGATFLCAGDKLIVLDEDGNLGLTTVTPDGLTVHSRCEIAQREAYTVPTLVGTTLYVRDRKHIMALDLS